MMTAHTVSLTLMVPSSARVVVFGTSVLKLNQAHQLQLKRSRRKLAPNLQTGAKRLSFSLCYWERQCEHDQVQ